VAKTQPAERVEAAHRAGLRDFGENYVQELERHADALAGVAPPARWHVIGHLQTNKAKKAAERATLIHTVDSTRLARALGNATAGRPSPLGALVEVNLGGEASKSGVPPTEVEAVLTELRAHAGLEARGLMCIPPPHDDPRKWFGQLREHAVRLRASTGLALPELSMGMSADFEDAIAEGATLVRVGTAIFGERLA
jgi:PLP dependent protein